MRIKGKDPRSMPRNRRSGVHRLPDNSLVADMDTIKHSNGQVQFLLGGSARIRSGAGPDGKTGSGPIGLQVGKR
jgi:hypothetical protein